jgi:hypothetical protein
MKEIISELKRQVEGEKPEPEQLKELIRGGYRKTCAPSRRSRARKQRRLRLRGS